MASSLLLRRRLAAGALLLAALAGAGFHHHEDLSGALFGADPGRSAERVLSSHSPLSRAAHWHSGVSVKDDACLACQSQRTAGLSSGARAQTPVSIARLAAAAIAAAPVSVTVLSNGPRAPPSAR